MKAPAGTSYVLKDIHRNKPFYRYLRTINGIYYSTDGDIDGKGANWKMDKSMRNLLEFYDEVK